MLSPESNYTVNIVPWYSSNEWMEVYQQITTDDIIQWKAAYSQMSTWKARVYRLPIGIEATLPLLQARRICHGDKTSSDQDLEPHITIKVIGIAISGFVDTIVKPVQDCYYGKKSMHNLALLANLPTYLVALRHECIHGGDPSSSTLKAALDTAWNWIIKNYWDIESLKMSPLSMINKPIMKSLDPITDFAETDKICSLISNNCDNPEVLTKYLTENIGCNLKEDNNYIDVIMLPESSVSKVCWKKIVIQLLVTDNNWTSSLALQMIKDPVTGIDEDQIERIINLVNITSHNKMMHLPTFRIISSSKDSKVYTVEMIKKQFKNEKKKKKNTLKRLNKNQGALCPAPLGQLRGYSADPNFYKKLILNIPDIQR